jgi:hypothetical protein
MLKQYFEFLYITTFIYYHVKQFNSHIFSKLKIYIPFEVLKYCILKGQNDLFFYIFFYSFIHMCIHCLDYFFLLLVHSNCNKGFHCDIPVHAYNAL